MPRFYKHLMLTFLLLLVTTSAWAKTMTGYFFNPRKPGDFIEYRLPGGSWLPVTDAYGMFRINVPENVIVTVRIRNYYDNSTASLRATAAWQTSALGVYHR